MTISKTRVGVIGIGAMGMAMARHLLACGYLPVVRDIRVEAEQQALQEGMEVAASPAQLIAKVDVVLVVVVDAVQNEEVLFGADGVVHGPARGKTVLLCSTIAPEDTSRLATRLAEHGADAIDAPISGGPARAQAGTISMMLGAPAALLERHQALLATLSDKRFVMGERAGDGAKAKLVNNLLAGINLVAGAEALALGIRVGLAPDRLFELICASSGASWIFRDRMQRALQGDFEPRAFAHILTKDLTLATRLADGVDYDTPLGDAALTVFRSVIARGWKELDDAAVLKDYLEPRTSDSGADEGVDGRIN